LQFRYRGSRRESAVAQLFSLGGSEHFMKTLTKDQIRRLTPEQQDTLAAIEVQRAKKREQLSEQARRYRGQQWLPALGLVVLFLLPVFTFERFLPWSVIILLACLWGLIQFHAAGVNRRLDALVELMEADKKKEDDDAAS
jgi:hypothetical protein